MAKTIHSDFSQHDLYVSRIDADELPALEYKDTYAEFYEVRNANSDGVLFMYLGKGDLNAPKEIVVWYVKSGQFWSGFGRTFKEAIEGAQRDGWLYA